MYNFYNEVVHFGPSIFSESFKKWCHLEKNKILNFEFKKQYLEVATEVELKKRM